MEKYTNKKTMTKTSSSGIGNQNGRYLLLFGNRQWQSFTTMLE